MASSKSAIARSKSFFLDVREPAIVQRIRVRIQSNELTIVGDSLVEIFSFLRRSSLSEGTSRCCITCGRLRCGRCRKNRIRDLSRRRRKDYIRACLKIERPH